MPGVAVSSVLHRLHRTSGRGQYRPPRPRCHRDGVRRSDRRTARAHAIRASSARTPPGCCARRSPTTCCGPPAGSLTRDWAKLAGRPCAERSSPFPRWGPMNTDSRGRDQPAETCSARSLAGPGPRPTAWKRLWQAINPILAPSSPSWMPSLSLRRETTVERLVRPAAIRRPRSHR